MLLTWCLAWLKEIIAWSWTYLWAAWFILVAFVLFYLRGPLKIGENLGMATMFLSTLTPKVITIPGSDPPQSCCSSTWP